MAKLVRTEKLVASNGAVVLFDDWPAGAGKPAMICFKINEAHWPLDEFDELVEYINAHREKLAQEVMSKEELGEMKTSELEASDEPQTDG